MTKIFNVKTGVISNLGTKAAQAVRDIDIQLEQRTKAATNIVWRTAHAKRPMMNKQQAKAHGSRVSLPDPSYNYRGYSPNLKVTANDFSILGVPVRTGRLQASIVQTVSRVREGFRGVVQTFGIHYAQYVEYGTSKMAARPFMRPAAEMNREVIKRVYGARIEHSL